MLTTISVAATLLRVFARSEDRLWLPSAVPETTLRDVEGLARPHLVSGSIPQVTRSEGILAWGETPRVAALRRKTGTARRNTGEDRVARLWNASWSTPEAAAVVNDRRFCIELADELGCALPGTRLIHSLDELEAHLAAGGANAASGHWVLKARFSAAGRWRLIHHQPRVPAARSVRRMLERHGPLLFEPWMERTLDVGCCGLLDDTGLSRIGSHILRVDAAGRFQGVELFVGKDSCEAAALEPAEARALESALKRCSDALGAQSYRGPFGIDAWRYRQPNRALAFHPLGEINARLTFGWVAHALVDRLRKPYGIAPGSTVRLTFDRQLPESCTGSERPTRVIPLAVASQPIPQAIWLDIRPAEGAL